MGFIESVRKTLDKEDQSRRRFLQSAVSLGASALVPFEQLSNFASHATVFDDSSARIRCPEEQKEKKERHIVADVLGIHGPPIIGGGEHVDATIKNFLDLGLPRGLFIEPGHELLVKAQKVGLQYVTRLYIVGNTYRPFHIEAVVDRVIKRSENRVFQPYNEPDRRNETGGKKRLPETHIQEDFLPAALDISSKGGITLLSPLSPVYDFMDRMEYFERMILQLKKSAPSISWIQKNVDIATHIYDEDPVPILKVLDDIVVHNLKIRLSLYVTEFGISDESELSLEEILRNEFPEDLQVHGIYYWLVANRARRKKEHFNKEEEEFEKYALVAADGQHRDAYHTIFSVVSEKRNQLAMASCNGTT